MTRDEIAAFFEHRQELLDEFDAAALAAGYVDDTVIESPSAGVDTGPEAAEHGLRAVFAAFLDVKTKSEALLIDGNRVAEVRTIEGTHIGEFMGVPPTGRPFRLSAVFLYEVRDRTIIHERRL